MAGKSINDNVYKDQINQFIGISCTYLLGEIRCAELRN